METRLRRSASVGTIAVWAVWIGIEEILLARDHIAAPACLLVDQQLLDGVRLRDHAVGMIDPLGRIEQAGRLPQEDQRQLISAKRSAGQSLAQACA